MDYITIQHGLNRVRVIADSVAPSGWRLTTLEVTFPRIVLAELNTHRLFSRNSASSRAIPVKVRLADMRSGNLFVPEAFGKNKSGMQASENLDEEESAKARKWWLKGAKHAMSVAEDLDTLKVHKQLANRVLEPYVWHTALISSTHWSNWDGLRAHPDAQGEIAKPAHMMKEAMAQSRPVELEDGGWHLPYVSTSEEIEMRISGLPNETILKVSAARCCRVSLNRQDVVKTLEEDIDRHDSLLASGHMSPLEHQAEALNKSRWLEYGYELAREWVEYGRPVGNYCGWRQYRKTVTNEHDFSLLQL